MSIARRDAKNAKVLKALNFFASGVRFLIKVLADLENRLHTFSIDIKVLTDLKRQCTEETVCAVARQPTCARAKANRACAMRRALLRSIGPKCL